MKSNRIKLDWGRLLGFKQVRSGQSAKNTDRAKSVLAAKIGGKPGGGGGPPGGVIISG